MKSFILFLFLFLFFNSFLFSQALVTRDPYWTASDEIKWQARLEQNAKEYAILLEEIEADREQLKLIKEATKKLKEINRKVANYKYLEDCLVYTYRAYDKLEDYSKKISRSDLFKPDEYTYIMSLFDNCLSMTSRSIDALSAVVTDNFSEMSDGERLYNLQVAISELRSDLGVFYGMMQQVDILYNQRLSCRTYQVFVGTLK